MLIKTIDNQKYQEASFQASIHGLKMKPRDNYEPLDIPDKAKNKLDKISKNLLDKMKTGKIKYGK